MKKFILSSLFIIIMSLNGFSQFGAGEQSDNHSSPSLTERSGPFSDARTPYCSKCRKRHYHGCTPSTPPPTSIPIDGGLGLLLVAGAAYGARRMRAAKK